MLSNPGKQGEEPEEEVLSNLEGPGDKEDGAWLD